MESTSPMPTPWRWRKSADSSRVTGTERAVNTSGCGSSSHKVGQTGSLRGTGSPAPSLPDQVTQIPLVLIANELQQFRVRNQLGMQLGFPRFLICLWIVDRELNVHMPHVPAMNPLGQTHRVAGRIAAPGKPGLPIR